MRIKQCHIKPPIQHLCVGQVANVYGVSIPTIWRWLKENKIPKPTKIGGSKRWLNIEIENSIKTLHKDKY